MYATEILSFGTSAHEHALSYVNISLICFKCSLDSLKLWYLIHCFIHFPVTY